MEDRPLKKLCLKGLLLLMVLPAGCRSGGKSPSSSPPVPDPCPAEDCTSLPPSGYAGADLWSIYGELRQGMRNETGDAYKRATRAGVILQRNPVVRDRSIVHLRRLAAVYFDADWRLREYPSREALQKAAADY